MVKISTAHVKTVFIKRPEDLPDLRNKKILFAIELNEIGVNTPLLEIFSSLYERGKKSLSGSIGGVFIHSPNELYTKSVSKNIIFLANQLGCRFPGHPMVEATGNLSNFLTWKKRMDLSLEEICYQMCEKLVSRLIQENPVVVENPNILALHASSHKTSNTLMLWNMIKQHLDPSNSKEIHVENGTIRDCIGCSYQTCIHFGQQNSCFYGGIIVEEVLPAIEKADGILWICPNYNDSVSANLMAVINRLTSLYRTKPLYDKTLFSIVVSGNSGSDSVAKQLIDALNINKGFRLPPYFSLMETANDPETIKYVENIEEKAKAFAQNMMKEIKR